MSEQEKGFIAQVAEELWGVLEAWAVAEGARMTRRVAAALTVRPAPVSEDCQVQAITILTDGANALYRQAKESEDKYMVKYRQHFLALSDLLTQGQMQGVWVIVTPWRVRTSTTTRGISIAPIESELDDKAGYAPILDKGFRLEWKKGMTAILYEDWVDVKEEKEG